jgi:hypothetical protein
MNKEQTPIEWIFEQFFNSFEKFNNGEYTFNDYFKRNLEIRKQAKEMDKKRMDELKDFDTWKEWKNNPENK